MHVPKLAEIKSTSKERDKSVSLHFSMISNIYFRLWIVGEGFGAVDILRFLVQLHTI